MGINSSALCDEAKETFLSWASIVPEAYFCAQAVDDGKGDSEAISKAAQAWAKAGQQLSAFRDDLAGALHSVPESEWQAADREAYERTANQYLKQVSTMATSAEGAAGLLGAAEAALWTYASFAMAEAAGLATEVAADQVTTDSADCTSAGAAKAKARQAGTKAYEALEAAGKVLKGTLSAIAAALEAGAVADAVSQKAQGDSGVAGAFHQASRQGAKADAKLLPDEAKSHAQGKIDDMLHGAAFPGEESSGDGEPDNCEEEVPKLQLRTVPDHGIQPGPRLPTDTPNIVPQPMQDMPPAE